MKKGGEETFFKIKLKLDCKFKSSTRNPKQAIISLKHAYIMLEHVCFACTYGRNCLFQPFNFTWIYI